MAGSGLLAHPAQAQQNITVDNFSFEGPVAPLQPGGGYFYTINDITNWNATNGSSFGVFDSTKVIGEPEVYPIGAIPDGSQVAFVNFGSIYQDVGATFTAGNTYTLSVCFGQREDAATAAGSVSFFTSNGAELATSSQLTSKSGTFTKYSFDYTATNADQGEEIQIRLNQVGPAGNGTTGSEANFDDVTLTQTPAVPEASTIVSFGLLLALGLGGMAVAVKRKKALGQ